MPLLRRQLLKVIEWTDARSDLIAWKFPMNDRAEIMNGSTLVVREGQVAIFCKDGKIADIFAPGRHKLQTANLPVLTTLMSWPTGFKSPFRCDVYYINTTIFTGQKWGTANPFTMRDNEFGVIRIRAFGTYNFKVIDPKILMLQLLGASREFTVANIKEKLRSLITSNISGIIATSKYSAIDLATKLADFNTLARTQLQEFFQPLGFEMTLFVVENISFPEEVERTIDSRASVGLMADRMGSFVAMTQAKAMRDMANNTGGGAMMGGMMMGGGMFGGAMGGGSAMNQAKDTATGGGLQQPQAPQPSTGGSSAPCSKCQVMLPTGTRFCSQCGMQQSTNRHCTKCGTQVQPGAKFCGSCGQQQ